MIVFHQVTCWIIWTFFSCSYLPSSRWKHKKKTGHFFFPTLLEVSFGVVYLGRRSLSRFFLWARRGK